MQVDIMLAASLDGFIARVSGKTDWVKDDDLFEQMSRDYGCICTGNTTYKEFGKPPFDGVQTIVLSREVQPSTHPNLHFVKNVADAMAIAQKLGFKKMLVIGGAQTNKSFLEAGVVGKVFADIHQITLGKGKPMFADFKGKIDFTLQNHTWHDPGFMHAEYTINGITKGDTHGHPVFADEPR